MRHVKNIIPFFESIKEKEGEVEVTDKLSDDMIAKIKKSYEFLKGIKISKNLLSYSIGQGWWNPNEKRYYSHQEHENFKICMFISVGIKENYRERSGGWSSYFEIPEDTDKYVSQHIELMKESQSVISQVRKMGDVRIKVYDDLTFTVYIIFENEDSESTKTRKISRIKALLDKYFSDSGNDHSSKSMNISQPHSKTEKVRDIYKDLFEILSDNTNLIDMKWNPEREDLRLRFTYSSRMEGDEIVIRFSPIKYRSGYSDIRIKPLPIEPSYKNMINFEMAKIIKDRISKHYGFKDFAEDITMTSKGDEIKIRLK
jgi:hypothetical protein